MSSTLSGPPVALLAQLAEPASLPAAVVALLSVLALAAVCFLIAWRRAARSGIKLRRERADLLAAFDSLPACIWTQDPQGRIVRANRATAELLGRPLDDLLGQPAAALGLSIRPPSAADDPPSRIAFLRPRTPQIALTDAAGVARTLHATRVSRHNADDSPAGELVFALDVTERVHAEQELLRERQLFTGGPCVVFRWKAAEGWPVEYVSPNVSQLFGYGREEWLNGRVRYADVVHPDDLARVADEVRRYSDNGTASFEQHYRIIRADGEVRDLFDFTRVNRDAAGAITHFEGYVLDMSEMRRSEHARRLADTRLRVAIEQFPAVFWSTDRELRFTSSKGRALAALGSAPDANIGVSLYQYFGTDDRGFLPIAMHLRALAGESVSYEIRWMNRVFQSVLEPLRDEREQIAGVIGFAMDITERTLSEESLRQSQHFLRCVLDGLREQIAILDEAGVLIATNTAWNRHCPAGDPLGQDYAAACAAIAPRPAEFQQLRESVARVLAGTADERAVEIARTDGRGGERWFEVRASGFGDKPHRWVALVQTDITARKLAESVLLAARDQLQENVRARTAELLEANRQLESTRQRLEYLLSVTPAILLTRRASGDFAITFITGNVSAVLGAGANSVTTDSADWRALLHPDDRERVQAALGQIASGESRGIEYRIAHEDGQWRWLREELQVVRDAQGNPLELIGIGVDITEQRAAERRFEQSQRLAALGTLAAGVAHEINNPIGAILAIAQNARRRCDERPDAADLATALDKIAANVKRCGQVARSMLQFARQERTDKWSCDLNEVVERAVAGSSAYAAERGVRIHLQAGASPLNTVMNPLAIEQVAGNLIRNAIEASAAGADVWVFTAATDGQVRLEVADRGRGVSAAHRARMFEPFFTTRQEDGGTGLGLSIVHGIVQEHGGQIDVRGDDEYVTRIVVSLPSAVGGLDQCREF